MLLQEYGNKWHRIYVDLTRPLILLTRSIICFLLSLYMALYVLHSAIPPAYQR